MGKILLANASPDLCIPVSLHTFISLWVSIYSMVDDVVLSCSKQEYAGILSAFKSV